MPGLPWGSPATCVSSIPPFPASTRSFPVLLDFPAKNVRDRHIVIQAAEKPWGQKFFGRMHPPSGSGARGSFATRPQATPPGVNPLPDTRSLGPDQSDLVHPRRLALRANGPPWLTLRPRDFSVRVNWLWPISPSPDPSGPGRGSSRCRLRGPTARNQPRHAARCSHSSSASGRPDWRHRPGRRPAGQSCYLVPGHDPLDLHRADDLEKNLALGPIRLQQALAILYDHAIPEGPPAARGATLLAENGLGGLDPLAGNPAGPLGEHRARTGRWR